MNIQINRHKGDFHRETIEFEVKCPPIAENLNEETIQFEYETGTFVNGYAQNCFDEIKKTGYKWLDNWSFAGRSNGWFALLISKGHFVDEVQQRSVDRIEKIVKRYFDEYADELMNFYNIS